MNIFRDVLVKVLPIAWTQKSKAAIGVAMDAAVIFGAIQAREGGNALADAPLDQLRAMYQQKSGRL